MNEIRQIIKDIVGLKLLSWGLNLISEKTAEEVLRDVLDAVAENKKGDE